MIKIIFWKLPTKLLRINKANKSKRVIFLLYENPYNITPQDLDPVEFLIGIYTLTKNFLSMGYKQQSIFLSPILFRKISIVKRRITVLQFLSLNKPNFYTIHVFLFQPAIDPKFPIGKDKA
jgi:hypothetical protein